MYKGNHQSNIPMEMISDVVKVLEIEKSRKLAGRLG